MRKVFKLTQKYNGLSPAVKASFWFTVCSILQRGMSFLTVPIFTRIMTTEEYGYVTLYQSWLTIFTVLCTLNVTYGGFYNGMIKYKNDKEGYTSSVLVLSSIMTGFWFVIFIAFKQQISEWLGLNSLLITLMFLEILCKAAYDTWTTRQKYEFNYVNQTIATVICVFVTPILGVILVLNMKDKVLGRILSFIIVYVILGAFLYISILKKSKNVFSLEYWKFSILFCIPLLPQFFAQTILGQSDRVMINSMVSTSAAAIYGFSYNIGMILIIVYQAVNNSFIPWLYQKLEMKQYGKINNIAVSLLIMIGVLVCGFMLFAPEIVIILGGQKYAEAAYVIPPVVASVYFMFLASIFSNIEMYCEKNKYAMIASTLAALLNLGLNYIFIRIYGYIAAGYTTLACYLFLAIGHYYCYRIVCKRNNLTSSIYNMPVIASISTVVVGFTFVACVSYRYFFVRIIIIFVMAILLIMKRNSIGDAFSQLRERKTKL